MELSLISMLLVFVAGMSSILSPCVLPVVPIVVTGTEQDSRWRPLFIVGGLSVTFIAMGVASALLGGVVTAHLYLLERVAAAVIILFGVLLLFDIQIMKYVTFFNRFQQVGPRKSGNVAALMMGMTLGLVWIPCVGGQLGAVLALIATGSQEQSMATILSGVFLMILYSVGFSVPLLAAGYSSQLFREKMRTVMQAGVLVRLLSGLLLIGFGLFIWMRGMLAFQLL